VTAKMVNHLEPSEAALRATFYEYKLPAAFGLPHSIAADNHGNGWFAEYSFSEN
jgi:streptogramin lyase